MKKPNTRCWRRLTARQIYGSSWLHSLPRLSSPTCPLEQAATRPILAVPAEDRTYKLHFLTWVRRAGGSHNGRDPAGQTRGVPLRTAHGPRLLGRPRKGRALGVGCRPRRRPRPRLHDSRTMTRTRGSPLPRLLRASTDNRQFKEAEFSRGACKTSFVGSASAGFRSQNSVFRIVTLSRSTCSIILTPDSCILTSLLQTPRRGFARASLIRTAMRPNCCPPFRRALL